MHCYYKNIIVKIIINVVLITFYMHCIFTWFVTGLVFGLDLQINRIERT